MSPKKKTTRSKPNTIKKTHSQTKKKGEQSLVIDINRLFDPSVLLSLILVIVIGAFFITYKPTTNSDTTNTNNTQPAADENTATNVYNILTITDQDRIYGPRDAQVTVVEFVDFECPFCRRIYDYPKRILKDFPGRVNWVFKNFPLSFHEPYATREAMFMECIADEYGIDAYIKLHDKIFTGDGKYSEEQLANFVAELGYNKDKVVECVKAERFKEKIQNDFNLGQQVGVQGTPTMIILDHKNKQSTVIPGAVAYENVKSQIEAILQK